MPNVSDLELDANCLHCTLSPIIEKFRQEHPGKSDADMIGEIAQVLGELAASATMHTGHTGCLPQILAGATKHALVSAHALIETMGYEERRQ